MVSLQKENTSTYIWPLTALYSHFGATSKQKLLKTSLCHTMLEACSIICLCIHQRIHIIAQQKQQSDGTSTYLNGKEFLNSHTLWQGTQLKENV